MAYNTERRRSSEDLNNLDKGTLNEGSKGSDKVVSNDNLDVDNLYSGTISLGSKGADKVASDKCNLKSSKDIKTALQSKKRKSKWDLTGGKTLFSRAAKQQGVPASGRDNDKTHCFGSEKITLPVVLVSIKFGYQLQSRRKRKMSWVEVNPVIS